MCMTVLLVPIDISKYTYGQMDFARNGLKKHVYLQNDDIQGIDKSSKMYFVGRNYLFIRIDIFINVI